MATASTSQPVDCKTIPLLSGSGKIKQTGFITLTEGEEYITHQIVQDPPSAGYSVALRLINGKANHLDKDTNSENFHIRAQLQCGMKTASLGFEIEKNDKKSKTCITQIQTTNRMIEITVTGGKSSCCGFGKESSYKLSVTTSIQGIP